MRTNSEKRIICPIGKELGDVHEILYGMPEPDFDFKHMNHADVAWSQVRPKSRV